MEGDGPTFISGDGDEEDDGLMLQDPLNPMKRPRLCSVAELEWPGLDREGVFGTSLLSQIHFRNGKHTAFAPVLDLPLFHHLWIHRLS